MLPLYLGVGVALLLGYSYHRARALPPPGGALGPTFSSTELARRVETDAFRSALSAPTAPPLTYRPDGAGASAASYPAGTYGGSALGMGVQSPAAGVEEYMTEADEIRRF